MVDTVLSALNSLFTFAIYSVLRLLGTRSYQLMRWLGILQQNKPRSWSPPPGGTETIAIENASELTQDEFLRKYLRQNRPVILRGAIDDWRALKEWSPEFMVEHFGDVPVKVQGSWFDNYSDKSSATKKLNVRTYFTEIWPQFSESKGQGDLMEEIETVVKESEIACLKEFLHYQRTEVPSAPNLRYQEPNGWHAELQRAFGQITDAQCKKYLSCAAFRELKEYWTVPKCFPTSGYWFPFTLFKSELPNERWFYDWGIYTSPRGTVTRMHIDGSRSHSLLCMVSGKKQCFLLPPSTSYSFQSAYAQSHVEQHEGEPCFKDCPQLMKDQLPMQALEYTLQAGEVIFIPKNWLHEVHTTESSFMITYNFLHGPMDLLGSLMQQARLGWAGGMFLNKL